MCCSIIFKWQVDATVFLSFRVLKIPFIKENMGHSQSERVKKNAINKFKK